MSLKYAPVRFVSEEEGFRSDRACVLKCPNCGEWYTHAGIDDNPDIQREVISEFEIKQATIDLRADEYGLDYRSRYWCECCDKTAVLFVYQYKGYTMMSWALRA